MSISVSSNHVQPAWLLPQNEIHVWKATKHTSMPALHQWEQWLSLDERARAQKFFFEKDRRQFTIARGGLRKLLGLYLDIAPGAVRFQYNAYGKPALDLPEHPLGTRLQFNVSHSHELILYAFVLDRAVGVDVEYMRSDIEHEALAASNFSPYEQQALQRLPAHLRLEGFYNCWTRKEAYIKARGQGLSLPLTLFDVNLAPGQPAALIDSREGPQERGRWSMRSLAPENNYAGALAVEGHAWTLKYFVMVDLNDFSLQETRI